MSSSAPAAGTGSPRGAAEGIPQQDRTPEVPLYDEHHRFEQTISRVDAEHLERAGQVRVVRSRGAIVRVYRLPANGEEFYQWQRGASAGATVMQARRIVRGR